MRNDDVLAVIYILFSGTVSALYLVSCHPEQQQEQQQRAARCVQQWTLWLWSIACRAVAQICLLWHAPVYHTECSAARRVPFGQAKPKLLQLRSSVRRYPALIYVTHVISKLIKLALARGSLTVQAAAPVAWQQHQFPHGIKVGHQHEQQHLPVTTYRGPCHIVYILGVVSVHARALTTPKSIVNHQPEQQHHHHHHQHHHQQH